MKVKNLLIPFLAIFLTTSCLVERVQVGSYDASKKSTILTKSKDIYLFWGIVPLRRTEKRIKVKDYEKTVRRSVFDTVVFYGTAGIFSFYTVTIRVAAPHPANDPGETNNTPTQNP